MLEICMSENKLTSKENVYQLGTQSSQELTLCKSKFKIVQKVFQ